MGTEYHHLLDEAMSSLSTDARFTHAVRSGDPDFVAAEAVVIVAARLEEEAFKRAVAAFLGDSQEMHRRYATKLAFKVTVDAFAQIMVAGVFGRVPMSEAEINKRIELVNAVPIVLPPDVV